MKRILTFILLSLLAFGKIVAYDFKANDICYIINDDKTSVSVVKGDENDFYGGSIVIPSTVSYNGKTYNVTMIRANAFESSYIASITLPSSIVDLGESAFMGCQNLTTVELNGGIKTIKDYTFADCISLKSIDIPEGIETIGDYAFAHRWEGNGELQEVSFPSTLKEIGKNAFYANNLKEIILPDNVQKLDKSVFYMCYDLEKIVFSKGMTEIPEGCCWSCKSLSSVTIPNTIVKIGDYAFNDCESLESITLPESVIELGRYTFSESSLKSIKLPSNLTYIGETMFWGCKNLTSFIIPNTITEIRDQAFQNCVNLTEIVIPESVVSIGGAAFKETGIDEMTLPSGVLEIKEQLFYGCKALRTVKFEGNVTTIGEYAFGDCNALTDIVFPKTLQILGISSFSNCVSLKEMTLPPSLISLGDASFEGCTNLVKLHLNCPVPPSVPTNKRKDGIFGIVDVGSRCVLYVPTGSISMYEEQASTNYINFADIVEEDVDVSIKKCSTPIISYNCGKLIIDCETKEAEIMTNITSADTKLQRGNEIPLFSTYNITVYAKANGYVNSDVINATIKWRDGIPIFEGFSSVTMNEKEIADVNGDGFVNAADVVKIVNSIIKK